MTSLIVSLILMCNIHTCTISYNTGGETILRVQPTLEAAQCYVIREVPYTNLSYQRGSYTSVRYVPCGKRGV